MAPTRLGVEEVQRRLSPGAVGQARQLPISHGQCGAAAAAAVWTRLLITRDPVTRDYVDADVKAVLTAFEVTLDCVR